LAEKASPELARDALQAAAAPQAPPGFGFGLFQGPRLAQAADQTYHRVLDQTLAPLLVERLSQALRQESDPIARYDALRITLMLVTPERLQRAEVRRWAAEAIAAPGAMPPAGGASAPASTAPGLGEQQEWLRHLDALLERNAVIQVVRLDDNLVRAARAGVANLPFAQRVQQRLVARAREGRAREPLGGAQGLAELAGPGAVLAFAPQDAASAAPLIPAVLTRQAWREQIEPALDATIQELADEAGWVLGDRSPAMQRLVGDRAARDEVAQQVAQRHAQAVIAAWDRLLPSLALQAPADAAGLERLATGLAAPSSPLGELMKRLGLEFGAAVPSGASAAGTGATAAATSAATASAANAAFEAALAARYGALADYARGPGAAALPRLLDPLPAAARDPSPTRGAELVRDLRAEAARAPPPLREVWTVLADALGTQQRKALDRQLAGSMASLTQSCRRLVEDRFPFTPAARRDMPMADFARLFGPQGLLDEFFRANLAAQVDTRSRPWRLAGDAAPQGKAQASLRAFEFAADIRRLFFAAGGPLPQLQLRLTPVRMDDELLQFTLDVDGQLLRYENGPRRPKLLTWPGPAATQKVLMRIFPAGPSGVDAEVHEGPWALLRVLGRPSDTRGASGPSASAAVQLMVDGRTLSLDAATDGPVPARLLAELSGFRCPEGW
jgi:type VI secretion system protein ImpL